MERLSLVLATALALAACGDDNPPVKPDGGTKYDGIVTQKDGIPTGENVPLPDGPGKPDGPGVPSALQAVVNTIALPKNASEYACDIDGSGKKNAIGGVMAVINTLNLGGESPQAYLDGMLTNGGFLLLMDIQGKSIDTEPAAKLQAFLGADLDTPPNAKDNFSGSEELGVQVGSPTDLVLNAAITAKHIKTQPGSLVAPIPFGTSTTTVSLSKTVVEADLSSTPISAMTKGTICGAIPQTDIDTKLIPQIASDVDATYKSSTTPQATKDAIKILDTNGDGTISAQDLKDNLLLKLLLQADVDTNGDKTNDAMSIAIGFTGVACTIKK
ncbi:MAG: hypothetical protein ACOY3Y_09040 [Acidobacteriota bacterium]